MADSSFDIEAGVDRQEVDNAINQAAREVGTRFDFKDTGTIIEWSGEEAIKVESASEDRVNAALEVLKDKCVKRKVSLKALDIGEPSDVSGGRSRVDVKLVSELPGDIAKTIVKDIKATKLKVTPTNMGDRIRVSGKKRDDLQEIQAMVKAKDHDAPLRFTNYK
ncbi:YajQ family cyclic di-GMP-binding protein [Nitriliruptor alkaliphilus]|uniref:YajQ family cyclic di-GMP-binding protein n=1 Tax=Nitriliruptor alkaliphilus TaxID=427918 RepID=UPI000695F493|nr:YajQ family cyclic di-GMP-binding protein [Nitriliruptor alkaliphilus]